MKTAIAVTTIHVPVLLEDYARDAKKYGHEPVFLVVADKKTPPEAEDFCKKLAADTGLEVRWLSCAEQESILAPHPQLAAHLPWNSIQRRNVAHLLAWREGFDVIIAIDDDNFLHDENFIGLHHAGLKKAGYGRRYASGWFNCCSMLAETEDKKFYPRGYPLSERRHNPGFYWDQGLKPVGVNAGLWLGEPDIDAVTRLAIFPEAIGFAKQDSTILAPGTWCPFNSQNTALRRELLPAWFMSPHVGRFDDIWASYIVQACMAAMGHVLHFGHPLVHQDRNAHDLFHDFDLERLGMGLTDGFCAALRGMTIDGKSYAECTLQALTVIDAWSGGLKEEAHRAALDKFTFGYRLWIEALETK